MTKTVDVAELYNCLMARFDEDQLQALCFALGIDHENLRHDTKSQFARELALHFRRRGKLEYLFQFITDWKPPIGKRKGDIKIIALLCQQCNAPLKFSEAVNGVLTCRHCDTEHLLS